MEILIQNTEHYDALIETIKTEALDCWRNESREFECENQDTLFTGKFSIEQTRDDLLRISDISIRCVSDSHNYCFKHLIKELKSETF